MQKILIIFSKSLYVNPYMDALLSYLMFKISVKIIIVEFLIMALCALAIIFTKVFNRQQNQKRKDKEKKISDAITASLFSSDTPFSLNGKYSFRNFVDVFESFDHRFSDEKWQILKKELVQKYILSDAKKNTTSGSWLARQLSARTFLLDPELATENDLYRLIQDPKYLVRVIAAATITKTPHIHLLNEVFKKMSEETPLSRFFYRDALVNADQDKFIYMQEMLKTEKDPKISALLLDILSTRFSNNLFGLFKPFTTSTDRECRLLAIRAIGSITLPESIDMLIRHMEDSDWEVRAESIEALRKQHVKKALPEFENALSDSIWWVRLQAANALRSFGEEGKRVLQSQNASTHPLAHEIAAYSLSLE